MSVAEVRRLQFRYAIHQWYAAHNIDDTSQDTNDGIRDHTPTSLRGKLGWNSVFCVKLFAAACPPPLQVQRAGLLGL